MPIHQLEIDTCGSGKLQCLKCTACQMPNEILWEIRTQSIMIVSSSEILFSLQFSVNDKTNIHHDIQVSTNSSQNQEI